METCYPIAEKTSTGVIIARGALVTKIMVISDATNDCKWVIHDHATGASGTVLAEIAAETAAQHTVSVDFNPPLKVKNGMYGTLTGTGGSIIVYESENKI